MFADLGSDSHKVPKYFITSQTHYLFINEVSYQYSIAKPFLSFLINQNIFILCTETCDLARISFPLSILIILDEFAPLFFWLYIYMYKVHVVTRYFAKVA